MQGYRSPHIFVDSRRQGELALLAKADRTWEALLSGSKEEQVMFFNPRDLERVNEQRRAAGKKFYED